MDSVGFNFLETLPVVLVSLLNELIIYKINRYTSYGSDLFQGAGWVHYASWREHIVVFNSKIKRSNRPAEKRKIIKGKKHDQNYTAVLHCTIICEASWLVHWNIIIPISPLFKGTLIQWWHITRKLRTSWTWAKYVQKMINQEERIRSAASDTRWTKGWWQ